MRVWHRRQGAYSADPGIIQETRPEMGLDTGTTKMQFKQGLNAQESLTHM